jgi:hypothetical protein
VPPQPNLADAQPSGLLADSPFTVPRAATPWPRNADDAPRRAGVSAFGLGGTNAHLVVEGFAPLHHGRARGASPPRRQRPRAALAIVGVGSVFASPAHDGTRLANLPPDAPLPVPRSALHAPEHTRLLADVVAQMDVSQLLATTAAERALRGVAGWSSWRERIGVAVGLVGRTPRAVAAMERLLVPRLRRAMRERAGDFGLEPSDVARIGEALCDLLERSNPPTDPYTVMGLLPSIATARVASLFDLNGPSLSLDAGGRTIVEVMRAAERWLATGEAELMLAGAVHADARRHPWRDAGRPALEGATAEGGYLLALATAERARANGWSVLARVAVGAPGDDSVVVHPARDTGRSAARETRRDIMSAPVPVLSGLAELARAVDAVIRGDGGRGSVALRWAEAPRRAGESVSLDTTAAIAEASRDERL